MAKHASLTSSNTIYCIIDLPAEAGDALTRLPWIHRILLENVLRKNSAAEGAAAKAAILDWLISGASEKEIAFHPGRVLMHDTTCGPALADIAAMRAAIDERPRPSADSEASHARSSRRDGDRQSAPGWASSQARNERTAVM